MVKALWYRSACAAVFVVGTIANDLCADEILWISDIDGSWHDGANWDVGSAPGEGADVIIDRPAVDIVVTYSRGVTDINSLVSEEAFEFLGGQLTVRAPSVVNNSLTINRGFLTAAGPQASFLGNGVTELNSAGLHASSGGLISLPGATKYQNSLAQRTLSASGAGSRLLLPNVTFFEGSGNACCNPKDNWTTIVATAGGVVDLSGTLEMQSPCCGFVTQGERGIRVFADGNDSVVDLTSLTTFLDRARNTTSEFKASNGGTILIPNLISVESVHFFLDGTGTMATAQISQIRGGQVTVSNTLGDFGSLSDAMGTKFSLCAPGSICAPDSICAPGSICAAGSIDLSNLTVIDGASFRVSDGARMTIPIATTYAEPRFSPFIPLRGDRYFWADGNGSLLEFPLLISIEGTRSADAEVQIGAIGGGRVDLSKVTEISAPCCSSINPARGPKIVADGAESVVDLSSLSLFANKAPRSNSTIEATNGGTILLNDGTTRLEAITLIVNETGTISVGTLEVATEGRLTGSGTLSADLINAGSVTPGVGLGSLEIDGNYTQSLDGRLTIDLAGADAGNGEFDHLIITGQATFGGAFKLSLIDGFIPVAGQSFDVVSYASHSGQFDSVETRGVHARLEYGDQQLTLVVGMTGDVNFDNQVDRADLAQLAAHYGALSGASPEQGDLNGDGRVDLSDLAILRRHMGEGAASAAAVPEPSSVTLTLLAAFAFAGGRRWQRDVKRDQSKISSC